MRIALMGTGLIGTPMAEKLLEAGHDVMVYNRTAEKTVPLQQKGAKIAKKPREAVAFADCTMLTLLDAHAINSVLFQPGEKADFTGKTIIQMGTILSEESLALKDKVSENGGDYLEALVLGSIPEVKAGKLIIMIGASQQQFRKWQNLLQIFGPEPIYAGPVGKAAAMKLALNQLIASLTAAFSLSLGMVQRSGVDVELFMKIVRQSALYAPTYDKKLPRMLKRDYSNPNFPVKNLLKDMNLIYSEAKYLGLFTKGAKTIIDILKIALQRGLEDQDYSALYEAIDPLE
ncbi:MAG: NAD(P)-dependent oxidoreductase [Calditrichia bacterium]